MLGPRMMLLQRTLSLAERVENGVRKICEGPHARKEAEQQERTRWIVLCLAEPPKGTDMPIGKELSERPQNIELGADKRAATLRYRARGAKKLLAWLTVAHVIPDPTTLRSRARVQRLRERIGPKFSSRKSQASIQRIASRWQQCAR